MRTRVFRLWGAPHVSSFPRSRSFFTSTLRSPFHPPRILSRERVRFCHSTTSTPEQARNKFRVVFIRLCIGSFALGVLFSVSIVVDALLFDEYKNRAMPWEESYPEDADEEALDPEAQLNADLAHLRKLGEDTNMSFWHRKIVSPIRQVGRALYLIAVLLPLAVAAPFLVSFLSLYIYTILSIDQNCSSCRGVQLFGIVGWFGLCNIVELRLSNSVQRPFCIKHLVAPGQWLGTRSDLIGEEMSSHLRELQSRAPAHSFEDTRRELERAYGTSLDQIFEDFDPKPLASGAIAQVHKAKYSGREVAVKVRHPGVAETLYGDLTLAISVVRTVSRIFPAWVGYFRPEDGVAEFAKCMLDQLDLVKEAQNLVTFRQNFAGNENVVFPEPFLQLCQPSVLVETFEPGVSIIDFMNRPDCGRTTANMLGRASLQLYFKMMITDNFSHDDLHPGNVLVRWAPLKRPVPQWVDWTYRFIIGMPQEKPDTVPPPPGMSPQLVILDAGLVTQLNRKDWQNFVDLFKAVITYNSERAARLMIERAPRRVATKEQEVRFQAQLTDLIEGVWQKDRIINIRVGEILRRALDIARTNNIVLDTKFASRVLGTIVVEGMARQVNPQVNMVVEATAFFVSHHEARRRMIRDTLGLAWHTLFGQPVSQK